MIRPLRLILVATALSLFENFIVSGSHGIELDGSRFWVKHRRRVYGPFDYEWTSDFCGVEMLYDGQKFGEYCSVDEIFADLAPFNLPMSVVRVTSIVMGCVLYGVLNGLKESERNQLLAQRLRDLGFERFATEP
jgi:hypothetical protein